MMCRWGEIIEVSDVVNYGFERCFADCGDRIAPRADGMVMVGFERSGEFVALLEGSVDDFDDTERLE